MVSDTQGKCTLDSISTVRELLVTAPKIFGGVCEEWTTGDGVFGCGHVFGGWIAESDGPEGFPRLNVERSASE